MAYFPNGDSGERYQEGVCNHCAHSAGEGPDDSLCPVWELHLLYSYSQSTEMEGALNVLIPEEGIHPQLCRMFHPTSEADEYYAKEYIRTGRIR